MIDLPSLDPVTAALSKLEKLLERVKSLTVPLSEAAGHVLAEDLRSDRDSPPLDVSAMDGFAIRISDFSSKTLPIAGVSAAGSPPIVLPEKSAIRIFTGAPIPIGADTVLVRECSKESNGEVSFDVDANRIQLGQHIRKRGENGPAQHLVISSGSLLSATAMAVLSTFGQSQVSIYRKMKVAIINTGDELIPMGKKAEPWQIRDSNGPYLEQFLRQQPWISTIDRQSVGDDPDELKKSIEDSLSRSDVLLLTGGVSMGDYDYVPEMIRQSGCQVAFHRLPIRPGKPILGAIGPNGQLVCGLPGNPVSVAVTARRIAIPLMRKMAGLPMEDSIPWRVAAPKAPIPPIDLIHYRLCNIDASGECQWTPMMGSGDVIALSQSHGFLELPPNYPNQVYAGEVYAGGDYRGGDFPREITENQTITKRYRFFPW